MNIEFKRLTEVNKYDIIELMNNQLIRKHMPLLKGEFDEDICHKFINSKEILWLEYGYGPWGFLYNKTFIGWGGLQPENGEADMAMVLHPKYWGLGKTLYKKVIDNAFYEMGLKSITVLLPPSRTLVKGLLRLGFKQECSLEINNEHFIRYRLKNEMRS